MREREAAGEGGDGRQVEAVTGAWLPGAAAGAGGTSAGPAGAGGTLAGAGGGPEFLINLGASHPSAHGMLRLRLTLDGDRITAAEPEIGFMHRGAEKLFEARDYRQIIVLANRHDWLGAFASELGVVLAAERLAAIEVPARGVWARTMLAELNRALSHLAFLSSYPPEIAAAAGGEPGPAGPAGQREQAGAGGAGEPGRAGARDRAGAPEYADDRDRAGDHADDRDRAEDRDHTGEPAAARAAFRAREAIQSIMEEISGGRMHYMF